MPEENAFTIKNVRFGVVGDGGRCSETKPVHESVSLNRTNSDDSSEPYYGKALQSWSQTLHLRVVWWQHNNFAKIFGLRVRYFVQDLRRGKKSHKGKESVQRRRLRR